LQHNVESNHCSQDEKQGPWPLFVFINNDLQKGIKMNFIKFVFALALGSVGIVGPMSAHAISLYSGTILTINTGMPVGFTDSEGFIQTDVSPGSWFAMDLNGNSKISGPEKNALSQGTTGITIGRSNTAPGEITEPFGYFGQSGDNRVYTAITGGTDGLDMSGWRVTWNGNTIDMSAGAWGTGYANGVANFVWGGIDGGAYTLDYHATVPFGDPSGFGGVKYALHLEGCVIGTPETTCQTTPIPEASTYGMLLAGLGLVGAAATRRKQSMFTE
jgi:hypothetical protein